MQPFSFQNPGFVALNAPVTLSGFIGNTFGQASEVGVSPYSFSFGIATGYLTAPSRTGFILWGRVSGDQELSIYPSSGNSVQFVWAGTPGFGGVTIPGGAFYRGLFTATGYDIFGRTATLTGIDLSAEVYPGTIP